MTDSTRVLLTIPPPLAADVKAVAQDEGWSLNDTLRHLVSQGVERWRARGGRRRDKVLEITS